MSLATADGDPEEKDANDEEDNCKTSNPSDKFDQVIEWLNYFCKKVIKLVEL